MESNAHARRLLIVSPGFAPANAPDSHRARLSLPHWAALGWDVEVLAVRGEDVDAPQEPELLATLPAGIPIHRVRAWPRSWAKSVGVSSLSWRARGPLAREGGRLLARRKFDLVFFSTSQFGIFSLGPRWLDRLGVPYVLDFQDPWVTDYYDRPGAPRPPGSWKYRVARWLARRGEPHCLRFAAGVVCVSPRYLDDFKTRYAWFERARGLVLPFPAADTDLAHLQGGGEPPWPATPAAQASRRGRRRGSLHARVGRGAVPGARPAPSRLRGNGAAAAPAFRWYGLRLRRCSVRAARGPCRRRRRSGRREARPHPLSRGLALAARRRSLDRDRVGRPRLRALALSQLCFGSASRSWPSRRPQAASRRGCRTGEDQRPSPLTTKRASATGCAGSRRGQPRPRPRCRPLGATSIPAAA